MSFELRPIQPDEFVPFSRAASRAFGEHAKDEEIEEERPLFEFDRSLAAFDGDTIVGTGGILTFELTVPGSTQVPAAGVSWIGVLPTHRRRGILTSIMRQQFVDIRERDEPVAILYASESLIYGRFGYGTATTQLRCELEATHRAFTQHPPGCGEIRYVDKEHALAIVAPLYDGMRKRQPGAITRNDPYWALTVSDPERWWQGAGPRQYIVHYGEGGDPDGYASYRIKAKWDDDFAANVVHVREVVVQNPAAYCGLWEFLLNMDLVGTLEARMPVDEPLRWMLADPRRLLTKGFADGLWVRLVDIATSLAARRYRASDTLTFEVQDAFLPDNDGVYQLEGSPEGAHCKRTTASPDISLRVVDLGAVYLGGVRLSTLADAGRVVEHTPGALQRADALFAAEREPFCTTGF